MGWSEESPLVRQQARILPHYMYADYGPKGVQGGERKATLLASIGNNFAARNSPWWGLTRRLRREGRACSPMGRSIASDGDPKGCRGRAESPLLASTGDNFAARNSPWRGLTRRLRRGIGTCRPMGRSHFSFGGERKVCKRKPAARRLREKALLLPIFDGGSSLCRAQHSWTANIDVRARS